MADELHLLDPDVRLARSSFWWLKWLRPSMLGPELVWPASFTVGGMLVYKLFQMIGSDPQKAYPLLMKWGPNVFGIVIVAVIIGALLNRLVDVMSENSKAQMTQAQNLGAISERLPDQSTQKDMQLQISFIAQQQQESNGHTRDMRLALIRIEQHMGITPEIGEASK